MKTANQTVDSPSNPPSASYSDDALFEEFQESEVLGEGINFTYMRHQVARATAVGSQPTHTTRRYDYHIIHSATFGVPVLYFNVCNAGA